jgi:hypothetical protein
MLLQQDEPREVTQLAYIHDGNMSLFVSGGWSRRVNLFRDLNNDHIVTVKPWNTNWSPVR